MPAASAPLQATHALLATVHAELQGQFVLEKVLGMFGHPWASTEHVDDIKRRIDSLGPHAQAMWAGTALFDSVPPSALTEAARFVLEKAQQVREELVLACVGLCGWLGRDDAPYHHAVYTLACKAGSAYAHEHWVRSWVRFYEYAGPETSADQVRQQLPIAADGVRAINGEVASLRNGGNDALALWRQTVDENQVMGAMVVAAENLARQLLELGVALHPLPQEVSATYSELLDIFHLKPAG